MRYSLPQTAHVAVCCVHIYLVLDLARLIGLERALEQQGCVLYGFGRRRLEQVYPCPVYSNRGLESCSRARGQEERGQERVEIWDESWQVKGLSPDG